MDSNALTSLNYTSLIYLYNESQTIKCGICFSKLSYTSLFDCYQDFLHIKEQEYFNKILHLKRKYSYLLGRYCAKYAINMYKTSVRERDILIEHGIFNHPIVIHPLYSNIQISISHMKNLGVAVSFPESYPMAIDIEAINTVNSSVIKAYFTENELSQISGDVLNFDTYLTLLWTVKEGLAKVLKCGLLVPLSVFEVSKIAVDNEYIQSFFKNFSQYQALSFISGDMVCSIVYPSNANISFNIKSYKKWLYTMCDIHDI